MCMDHWDFREILSWVALLFAGDTRWYWLWFCSGFDVLPPHPFGLGQCRCGCVGWLMRTGWGVNFFDQGDLRLKGMITEVSESHSKLR